MNKIHSRLMQPGKSLIGNTAIYLFSNILNAAIPFFLLPILTRYLTPAEYGVVGMFQMVLAIFAAFTGLSVHGAANRKYFDRDEGLDLSAFIASCVQIVIFSTLIVLFGVFMFSR